MNRLSWQDAEFNYQEFTKLIEDTHKLHEFLKTANIDISVLAGAKWIKARIPLYISKIDYAKKLSKELSIKLDELEYGLEQLENFTLSEADEEFVYMERLHQQQQDEGYRTHAPMD